MLVFFLIFNKFKEQKKHLARMLAIQLTKEGEGPGIEYIKAEKQKMFLARQAARSEGAIIPPTPMNDRLQDGTKVLQDSDNFVEPRVIYFLWKNLLFLATTFNKI